MVMAQSELRPSGGVGLHIVRRDAWMPAEIQRDLRSLSGQEINGLIARIWTTYRGLGLSADAFGSTLDRLSGSLVIESSLAAIALYQIKDAAPAPLFLSVKQAAMALTKSERQVIAGLLSGEIRAFVADGQFRIPLTEIARLQGSNSTVRCVEDFGIVSRRLITTAGVNYLVDAFQNTVEMENLKFHSLGTGSTAEAIGDTTLVTELTTEYTGNVRATGTTTEGASANIYRTVATNTLDGTPGAALREHGIHSASSAGTLWDRSVYGAITLSSGDGLETTYDMTASAGG
jgi:hypothetical protein